MSERTKAARNEAWEAGLTKLETSARKKVLSGRPCPAFTAQQIADSVGVSRQMIDRITNTALHKLRGLAAPLHAELTS